MKTYKVEVTKEDIQKGKPCKENMCPIARAVRRVVGKKAVWVSAGGTIKINHFQLGKCNKSDLVSNFVINFDDKDKRRYCRPFSFMLTVE